jgi:hypothetical protein
VDVKATFGTVISRGAMRKWLVAQDATQTLLVVLRSGAHRPEETEDRATGVPTLIMAQATIEQTLSGAGSPRIAENDTCAQGESDR